MRAHPTPRVRDDSEILTRGNLLRLLVAELAPAPGRVQAALRATTAVMASVLLCAFVGDPHMSMCPLVTLTECSPGTVFTPRLLANRLAMSLSCALLSIAMVAAFPQAQPILFLMILLSVWLALYLTRVLPVSQSGARLVVWTLGPLLSMPLVDPAEFDQVAMVGGLATCAGVVIAHATALLVFPGSESHRARTAVDELLEDAGGTLRDLAARARAGSLPDSDDLPPIPETTLTHITALTQEVAAAAHPQAMFPELHPLVHIAATADAIVPLVHRMFAEARSSPAAAAALADVADDVGVLFQRVRGLSWERHWARPGDRVPEVDELAAAAAAIRARGMAIINAESTRTDDQLLVVGGFARRCGGLILGVLNERREGGGQGASLAQPVGFTTAAFTGRPTTLLGALSAFDPAAALSAAASMAGMGFALVLSALFIPAEISAGAVGGAFVMQTTIGGSGRRGALRLIGTALGAVVSLVAMLIFAGGMQGIGSYLVVLSAAAFATTWITVGSKRTNYAGLMLGAAWVTSIVTDPAPPADIAPAIERLGSVLLSILGVSGAIWLFATVSARAALMGSLSKGWVQLASLVRMAAMVPVGPNDRAKWDECSLRITDQLSISADTREQYAFERRLRSTSFKPVRAMIAEQQRVAVQARALSSGRFLDHPLPEGATEALNAATDACALRLERLAAGFVSPEIAQAKVEPRFPSATEVRAAAEASGCSVEDIARLLFRRSALNLLLATIERSERIAHEGFVWIDGTLHSVLEEVDGVDLSSRVDILQTRS